MFTGYRLPPLQPAAFVMHPYLRTRDDTPYTAAQSPSGRRIHRYLDATDTAIAVLFVVVW